MKACNTCRGPGRGCCPWPFWLVSRRPDSRVWRQQEERASSFSPGRKPWRFSLGCCCWCHCLHLPPLPRTPPAASCSSWLSPRTSCPLRRTAHDFEASCSWGTGCSPAEFRLAFNHSSESLSSPRSHKHLFWHFISCALNPRRRRKKKNERRVKASL